VKEKRNSLWKIPEARYHRNRFSTDRKKYKVGNETVRGGRRRGDFVLQFLFGNQGEKESSSGRSEDLSKMTAAGGRIEVRNQGGRKNPPSRQGQKKRDNKSCEKNGRDKPSMELK